VRREEKKREKILSEKRRQKATGLAKGSTCLPWDMPLNGRGIDGKRDPWDLLTTRQMSAMAFTCSVMDGNCQVGSFKMVVGVS
jgi:hypothetical protein